MECVFFISWMSVSKSVEVSRSYHICPDFSSFIICFMKLNAVLKTVTFSGVWQPSQSSIPETMFHLCNFQHDRRQVLSLFMNMRDFVTECRLK